MSWKILDTRHKAKGGELCTYYDVVVIVWLILRLVIVHYLVLLLSLLKHRHKKIMFLDSLAANCSKSLSRLLLVPIILSLSLTFSIEMTNGFMASTSMDQAINSNVRSTILHQDLQSDVQDELSSNENEDGVKLGFIGCGTIASSIATGLLTQTEIPISSIIVSRRSESKSSALVEKFGKDFVQVSDKNQLIVDSSDIIFLCVLPEQEKDVLSSLSISEEKTLISLVVSICFVSLRLC